jgi:hypothetical protein
MKKVLLIICLIMAIFQLVVMATAIDIGNPAIDRTGPERGNGITWVDKNIPANATGKITTVEIWAYYANLAGCEVATFSASGNDLATRDYETVNNGNGAGVVIKGSKQTFTVDLDVVAGDYIGLYYSSGYLESDSVTCTGDLYHTGDMIPTASQTFSTHANEMISLHGIGATAEAGGNAIMMGINF